MPQAQTEDERYYAELKEYLTGYYSGRDTEVRKRRLARDGDDFTLEDVPEAYRSNTQIVHIKRNADVLQRTQAIITDDDPAWEVPSVSEDDNDKRNASLRERWLAAAVERMVEESGRDAIRMACDAALADGMGVLKLTYLPDAWKDEPERKYESEEEDEDGQRVKVTKEKEAKDYLKEVQEYRRTAPFPFWLEDVDVLCYYPLREGRNITKVLEISERPLLPAMQAFGVKATYEDGKRRYKNLRKGEKFPVNGGLTANTHEKVECAELWTKNDVTYYLDGQKVDYVQHNYGFINYVELPGYQTSSRDPAKAIRSVIDGQRELVRELRRVLTIWLHWAYLAGWPFVVEGEDTGNGAIPDNATNVTQLKVGAILPRGTSFLEPPQAGRDLGALAQIFQAEADRAGLASVMYGSASGISSGYMGSDLRAAAMSVLKPIIRNGGRALGSVGRMMQMMIDRRIKDTVYVYGSASLEKGGKEWLALGPKDIKGYYPVKATMRPLMPLDEVAQRDSAIRMYKADLWDPETALEKTGENQPERILDRVAAYKYMEESGMNSRIGERAAQKLGLAEAPRPQPEPMPILGPNGEPISSAAGPGLGGPGIGPIQPSVPGQNLPLRPPEPQGAGLPNQPIVIRSPGGGGQMPVGVP